MPKWADKDFKVPDIAVSYWNMPEGKRTMKDLILYIRADEAGHVSFPKSSAAHFSFRCYLEKCLQQKEAFITTRI